MDGLLQNNRCPGKIIPVIEHGTLGTSTTDQFQKIFYKGNGHVCAVTDIKNQSLPVDHPDQTYTCEGSGRLDDPYEGELFTFWLQFFAGLTDEDVKQLWQVKRQKLVSVDYNMGNVGPITVQKGLFTASNWPIIGNR